jgi:hypothetical protein
MVGLAHDRKSGQQRISLDVDGRFHDHGVMDIEAFVRDGFIAVREAFDTDTARECREAIWADLEAHDVHRDDRATWHRPAIRINTPTGPAFTRAARSEALRRAYDVLIGPGRWAERDDVGGTIPVRFPSEDFPEGIGWHIEGTWWGGTEYWADVTSRGRGLLALFLFSDVGPRDAPTRLVLGSHRYAAAALATAGDQGMPGGSVPDLLRPSVLCRTIAEATGRAGDVFLCHPFVVHTATWPHRGEEPRMMAQPGVAVPDGFALDGTDGSPVARAIVEGLSDTSMLRPRA